MPQLITISIDSNRKTCGNCRFLDTIDNEWWCRLFDVSRGLKGAQKTPNRSDTCLRADASRSPWADHEEDIVKLLKDAEPVQDKGPQDFMHVAKSFWLTGPETPEDVAIEVRRIMGNRKGYQVQVLSRADNTEIRYSVMFNGPEADIPTGDGFWILQGKIVKAKS